VASVREYLEEFKATCEINNGKPECLQGAKGGKLFPSKREEACACMSMGWNGMTVTFLYNEIHKLIYQN